MESSSDPLSVGALAQFKAVFARTRNKNHAEGNIGGESLGAELENRANGELQGLSDLQLVSGRGDPEGSLQVEDVSTPATLAAGEDLSEVNGFDSHTAVPAAVLSLDPSAGLSPTDEYFGQFPDVIMMLVLREDIELLRETVGNTFHVKQFEASQDQLLVFIWERAEDWDEISEISRIVMLPRQRPLRLLMTVSIDAPLVVAAFTVVTSAALGALLLWLTLSLPHPSLYNVLPALCQMGNGIALLLRYGIIYPSSLMINILLLPAAFVVDVFIFVMGISGLLRRYFVTLAKRAVLSDHGLQGLLEAVLAYLERLRDVETGGRA